MNRYEFYSNVEKFKNNQSSDELSHYGIIGQKWGTRRWQNADGTFNDEGKIRYFGKKTEKNPNGTVFISGSSKTQFDDNEFYRKELPKPIQDKIKDYMKSGKTILVGDAPGIDRQVQDFLKANNYKDVEVYSPGKKTRYSANPEWKVNHVDVPDAEEGSGEWLKGKDEAMTNRATEGLAITIEDGAIATRNNIDRLKSQDKGVDVFELKKNGSDDWTEQNDDFNENKKYVEPNKDYEIPINNPDLKDIPFSVHNFRVKDNNVNDVNKTIGKTLKYLNDKKSVNEIMDNYAEYEYKYYKEYAEENGIKPISESEFKRYAKDNLDIEEVGLSIYNDDNFAIMIAAKDNNFPYFKKAYDAISIDVDPENGKISNFYYV